MSTPATQVNICSGVLLDNRYQHTIYFPNRAKQLEYFEGKVVRAFPSHSHHRRNWELKVEATVEEAQGWNYLFIENPGVKPYFYFINKVEYVSDTTVKLYLELDVIQTHINEWNLLSCFVERQHTTSDRIGEHTVPEGLELGPYTNYHTYNLEDIKDMGILVLSALDLTYNINENTPAAYARKYDGVYSGMGVYAFNDMEKLETQLKALDAEGKQESVLAIWMYPKKLVQLCKSFTGTDVTTYSWSGFDWANARCANVHSVAGGETTLANYANYDEKLFQGFKPDNNKLYTYPYNLLYVTGHQGDKAELRFEHFNTLESQDNLYRFRLFGAISPDAGVKLAPLGYNITGTNINYDEGLTLGNYPPCAWDTDTYKVWLAQNYNQLAHAENTAILSGLGGVGAIVAGAVTGNLAMVGGGAVATIGSLTQISSIMAQKEDAKAQPLQAKGTFSSSVNVANGRQTFSFYYKCIRAEYAKQIDDFFTMYGYKVNRVQTPNINARPKYTYIKTVGCKVSGEMCNEDIIQIERIFDAGITFWKNGDNIGNYFQDNRVEA
jgi:hypothetical protein